MAARKVEKVDMHLSPLRAGGVGPAVKENPGRVRWRHVALDVTNMALMVFFVGVLPQLVWPFLKRSWWEDWRLLAHPFSLLLLYAIVPYWIICAFFGLIESTGWFRELYSQKPTRLAWYKIMATVLRNMLISNSACIGLIFLAWKNNPESWGRDGIGSGWDWAFNFFISGVFFTEVGFYTAHRAMHCKILFRFHKTHHEMNKESLTCAWGARYCGVVEDLLCNVGSTAICFIFLEIHPIWVMSWTTWAQWNALMNHTGYQAKYMPITASIAGMYHDEHHRNGKYDFGTNAGWMDWTFGTLNPESPRGAIVVLLDFLYSTFVG